MRKALITLLAVVTFHGSFAQIENQSYSELFKEAKLNIANHKEKEAIPQLEALYKRDEQNANVAYLLGLCYIKSYTKINQAIKLLESAKEDYSKFYDRTSVTERGVSEYVYYYLVIGYSLKGDCKQTIATLNEFYKIYSYEDEWFLIDGQKWHRDCGKHKWEDKDSIASSRDSLLVGQEKDIIQADDVAAKNGESDTYAPAEQITLSAQTPTKVSVEENSVYRNQYRDRLKRVGEAGGPEVMTRGVTYTAATALYGVQVGAYIKPRFSTDFKNIKNVEVYIDNNGVFRYVIGRFAYRTQAEKLLQYVKEEGYQDAFIVDIQSSGNYEEEVVRVNNESIKREIVGKIDFRVQIGAFKEEVPDEIMRIYLQLDDIKENIQGELTIFTMGSFTNYDIARAFCDNIKENAVKDAFVVAYNQNRKIGIEEANLYLQKAREKEAEKTRLEQEQTRKKKKR
ncbi:MAG: hypothetical protein KDC83_02465 [Flavobacteriales bacterium]|nr:hypothetical protein [Flavobacteriales bacterium]